MFQGALSLDNDGEIKITLQWADECQILSRIGIDKVEKTNSENSRLRAHS